MKFYRTWCCAVAWLGFSAPAILFLVAMALAVDVLAQQAIVPLAPVEEMIRLAPEAARTFSFPQVPAQADQVAVLCWQARIDADRLRSGQWMTGVAVNGQPVEGMKTRLHPRLLNKPLQLIDHRGRSHAWYVAGAKGWLTPFAPDFSVPGPLTWFREVGHLAYAFEVDITDQVNAGLQNQVTFHNLLTRRYLQKYRDRLFKNTNADLVLRDLRVELRPRSQNTEIARQADYKVDASSAAWTLRLEPSGDLAVVWEPGKVEAVIKSDFAGGDGKRIALAHGAAKLSRLSATEWKIALDAPFYRLERIVRQDGERIQIHDRFISKKLKSPVSVMPRYEIRMPARRFATAWIGGDPDPGIDEAHCPYNPTLFVPMGSVGLGLVVEDDVLRLQGKISFDADAGLARVRSDELVLSEQGGGQYSATLCVYPTGHADYWQFINRVRRDWQIRGTLPGTIWFADAEHIAGLATEALADFINTNKVAHVILWEPPSPSQSQRLQPPYFIKGAAQLEEHASYIQMPFEQNAAIAIRRVHQVAPHAKVLAYLNSHVCSIFQADRLPMMQDCLITDRFNKPVRRHAADPRFYPLYFVYPTESNSYGKSLTRLVDHYLELGADGIYWDEMPAALRDVKYTYSQFDGFSADIDPLTHAVTSPKGLVALLSSPYKIGLVQRLHREGKTVHANGAPEILAMNQLPITRMVETPDTALRTKDLHLTTPYAYTWGPFSMEQFRDRLSRGALCLRPETGLSFIAEAYPITPDQLGEGFVSGPERAITAINGRFGWQGSWRATLRRYDPRGRLIDQKQTQGQGDLPIDVPAGGLVILERLP